MKMQNTNPIRLVRRTEALVQNGLDWAATLGNTSQLGIYDLELTRRSIRSDLSLKNMFEDLIVSLSDCMTLRHYCIT